MTKSPGKGMGMSMTKSPGKGKGSTLSPTQSGAPSDAPSACPSEAPSTSSAPSESSAPSDSSAPSEAVCDLCFSATPRSWSGSQEFATENSCALATPLNPEEFGTITSILGLWIEGDSLWTEEENVSVDLVSGSAALVDQSSGSAQLGSLLRCCGGCQVLVQTTTSPPGKGTKSPGKGMTKSPGGMRR